MRKILYSCIAIILLLLTINVSYAASPYLKWDPVTTPEGVDPLLGYIIHYTRTGQTDNYTKDVGDVTEYPLLTDLNLAYNQEYTFAVTAYNACGESEYSNTVTFTRPNANVPPDNVPELSVNLPPAVVITVSGGDTLNWDLPQLPVDTDPILGYIVRFKEVGGASIYTKKIGLVDHYSLVGDLNLAYARPYEIVVVAYNPAGQGPVSNTIRYTRPNAEVPQDNVPDLIINVPPSVNFNITIVNKEE